MARFRKGTNDADGNGRKGGSLKAGSRFVKGTNDPDNDGRKGGSLPKGDDMAKAPKKAKPPVAGEIKAEAKKSATAKTAAMTTSDKTPEAQPTLAEAKEAAAEQFETADNTAAADARLRLAVRGF